jgi:hypothetical protein
MRVYLVYRMEATGYGYDGYEPELECVTLTEDKAKEIVNKLNDGSNIFSNKEAYYHYEDVIE